MPNGVTTEERLPVRLRNGGQGKNIFALTKLRMSSEHLSQTPLLIYPEGYIASTRHCWARVANPDAALPFVRPSMESDRRGELDKLRRQFEVDFPHLARAGAYYKFLTDPNRDKQAPMRFEFIDVGPTADDRVGDVVLGNPGIQPKPYKLRVVFHRAADGG